MVIFIVCRLSINDARCALTTIHILAIDISAIFMIISIKIK